MSAIALRQALGRATRAFGVFGIRAEHTAAATAVESGALKDVAFPSSDPVLRPYYEQLAQMEVVCSPSPKECSESERAVSCLPPLPPAAAAGCGAERGVILQCGHAGAPGFAADAAGSGCACTIPHRCLLPCRCLLPLPAAAACCLLLLACGLLPRLPHATTPLLPPPS